MHSLSQDYMDSARKQFAYYRLLGDRTFAQLTDAQLFWTYNEVSNSIAVMVNHMHGNMMSRWTDFLTSDGEKDWRTRDQEFEDEIQSREVLLQKWNQGWDCLFQALDTVNDDNFDTLVYIRNQGHSIPEAINRQLCHYAYHVGQIVFLGRMMAGDAWQSLSIPKGGSKAFNAEKFAQEKSRGHFTDEVLGDGQAPK